MIVLEDCHWIDALSRDLLEVLARALPVLRVLMVLAYRPGIAGALGIENMSHFDGIVLAELRHDHAVLLIQSKLN